MGAGNIRVYVSIARAARTMGLPRQSLSGYVSRSVVLPDALLDGRPIFDPSLKTILIGLKGFLKPGQFRRIEDRVLASRVQTRSSSRLADGDRRVLSGGRSPCSVDSKTTESLDAYFFMARRKVSKELIESAKLAPGASTSEMQQLNSDRDVAKCVRLTNSIAAAYAEILTEECGMERRDQLSESVDSSINGLRNLAINAERSAELSRALERALECINEGNTKLWKANWQAYRELQIQSALTAELEEKLAGIQAERAALNVEPELVALREAEQQSLNLRSEIAHNRKLATALERLCSLHGIDPTLDRSLPAAQKNIWNDYQAVLANERAGKVCAGSSFAFYKKHSGELHDYAASVRTMESSSK